MNAAYLIITSDYIFCSTERALEEVKSQPDVIKIIKISDL